jgi:ribonuclease-3
MRTKTHSPLDVLSERLGYSFQDITLLEMALTHRSLGVINNERLEFLGDAVLNFCIGEKLFHEYPNLTEGGLSRLRSNLVNGETLAKIAQELRIYDYLRLGVGEMKSGGVQRKSILANTMEAIIGAIYLDSGIGICQQRVLSWFTEQFVLLMSEGVRKDPKTQLQEHLQANKMPLPHYTLLTVDGREHSQVFKVQCRVAGLRQVAIGVGSSRRRAEQDAAQRFLDLLRS